MRIISTQTRDDGVTESLFTHHDIPGALWLPAGAAGPRPLVLLGHGGGWHKKAPGVVAHAVRFVTRCGFAAAAIDAPGHGDRPPVDEHQVLMADIRQRVEAGEALGPHMVRYNAVLAVQAVPEWHAVLDALLELDLASAGLAGGGQARGGPVVAGPVGYWGASMGGGLGIPFVAAEPRIAAAVLGLVAFGGLAVQAAPRITVPVEFVMQWDDEMVPRESALALFAAFGSAEKSLHANPGGHGAVPRFEADSAASFFGRHLAAA